MRRHARDHRRRAHRKESPPAPTRAPPFQSPQIPKAGGNARVPNDRYSAVTGRDLFEQFQPFAAHAIEGGEPGSVASRSRQALDETGTDGIDHRDEYDRDRPGSPATMLPRSKRAVARMTSGFRATNSAAYLRRVRYPPSPSEARFAGCGRPSSPIPADLARKATMRACASGSSAA